MDLSREEFSVLLTNLYQDFKSTKQWLIRSYSDAFYLILVEMFIDEKVHAIAKVACYGLKLVKNATV